MDKRIVYLSPSGLAAYENCPQSYLLERVLKVRTQMTSCSIGFGTSTGRAVELFLRGQVAGKSVDMQEIFREEWRRFTSMHAVRYTKGADAKSLEDTGLRLMELFPQAWVDSGYSVLTDKFGEPFLERKLKIDIGDNVILVTKLDLMVLDADKRVVLLDNKATAAESSIEYTLMADQLTAYNLAVDTHADVLGIARPDLVGYWEMLRRAVPKSNRGEGPVIRQPMVVPRRSQFQYAKFVAKCHRVADQIRAEQFGATPRMAFNSPCSSCSLAGLCARKSTDGLVFPSQQVEQVALRLAA